MKEPRFLNLKKDTRELAISQLKEQAYGMVAEHLSPVHHNYWGADLEENWERLLKESRTIGLYWDETNQAYSIEKLKR